MKAMTMAQIISNMKNDNDGYPKHVNFDKTVVEYRPDTEQYKVSLKNPDGAPIPILVFGSKIQAAMCVKGLEGMA